MSFHFTEATTSTFSLCCLLLSLFGIIFGVAETKSLPSSLTTSPVSSSNYSTTAIVGENALNNDTAFSSLQEPTNSTSFYLFSTLSSSGNDSLESLEEMDGANRTTGDSLMMEDDNPESILSSLISSAIDHNSTSILEENPGDGSGNGDVSTESSEMGSGSGETDDEMALEESGSGESGFGSSLISAIEGMFHFAQTNSTGIRNSTKNESSWTTDSTGMEIQALMFA